MTTFGAFFRKQRAQRGLTLRSFCLTHGFDAGNISKLERGRVPAPRSREKLEQYARALGIQEGSDDWYTFFDLAAAERGMLPADVMADKELLAKVPVIFRTIRGQKVTEKQLDDLIERIRRS